MLVKNIGDVKMFVIDVDGTLTDGKIYMSSHGEIMKAFSIKDGLGIKKLQLCGVEPVILTGRSSEIVSLRSHELGITSIYQGIDNKLQKLKEICTEKGYLLKNTVYIGDDENDLDCMKSCGHSACTADAWISVKENVDYVSLFQGGEGAVRDYIEYLINNKYDI